ncbi:putative protein OS=Streptomyces antimycoticus OX=68175 GN=SSPO_058490 PE=4 SV=1 [Streptomyces antimycoticus]
MSFPSTVVHTLPLALVSTGVQVAVCNVDPAWLTSNASPRAQGFLSGVTGTARDVRRLNSGPPTDPAPPKGSVPPRDPAPPGSPGSARGIGRGVLQLIARTAVWRFSPATGHEIGCYTPTDGDHAPGRVLLRTRKRLNFC